MNTSAATTTPLRQRQVSEEETDVPRVSIVIPVRNDASRLDQCLASLNSQSYPESHLEIIVVDNGSTDSSGDVARRHGADVISFPDLKVGALRNRGAEVATGSILAFVDSDHELPEDWVQNGVETLQGESTAGAIGAPCFAPRQGTWVQRVWELHRLRGMTTGETAWLGAGNMFVRRGAFDQIQGFREDLIATEDVDLCERMKRAGFQIRSDTKLVNYHFGEPKTVKEFFAKELWRGSNGLRAFVSHGLPLHELPSFAFPLYHLSAIILIPCALLLSVLRQRPGYVAVALCVLLLPSLFLAISTAARQRQLARAPALMMLYLTYGVARAVALLRL